MNSVKVSILLVLVHTVVSWPFIGKPPLQSPHAYPGMRPEVKPLGRAGRMFIENLKPLLNGEYRIIADAVHIDAVPVGRVSDPMVSWIGMPYKHKGPSVFNILDHLSVVPIKGPQRFPYKPFFPPKQPILPMQMRPSLNNIPTDSTGQKLWLPKPDQEHLLNKLETGKPYLYPVPYNKIPVVNMEPSLPPLIHEHLSYPKPMSNEMYNHNNNLGLNILKNKFNGITTEIDNFSPNNKITFEKLMKEYEALKKDNINSPHTMSGYHGPHSEVTFDSLMKEYLTLENMVKGLKEVEFSGRPHTNKFEKNENDVKLQQLLNGYQQMKEKYQKAQTISEVYPTHITPAKPPSTKRFPETTTNLPQTTTFETEIYNPTTKPKTILPIETTTAYPEITTMMTEKSESNGNPFDSPFKQGPFEKSRSGQSPFEPISAKYPSGFDLSSNSSPLTKTTSYNNNFGLPDEQLSNQLSEKPGSDLNSGYHAVLPGEPSYAKTETERFPVEKPSKFQNVFQTTLIPFPDIFDLATTPAPVTEVRKTTSKPHVTAKTTDSWEQTTPYPLNTLLP